MDQRLSLVTLGVADLGRAVAFYEALGWAPDNDWKAQDVAFFQGPGTVSGGWGGVTLAYNTRSNDEVDAVIEEARAAGARIGREPAETFWGGYSGLFVDPDGHPWEVAHNPNWTIEPDRSVRI